MESKMTCSANTGHLRKGGISYSNLQRENVERNLQREFVEGKTKNKICRGKIGAVGEI